MTEERREEGILLILLSLKQAVAGGGGGGSAARWRSRPLSSEQRGGLVVSIRWRQGAAAAAALLQLLIHFVTGSQIITQDFSTHDGRFGLRPWRRPLIRNDEKSQGSCRLSPPDEGNDVIHQNKHKNRLMRSFVPANLQDISER